MELTAQNSARRRPLTQSSFGNGDLEQQTSSGQLAEQISSGKIVIVPDDEADPDDVWDDIEDDGEAYDLMNKRTSKLTEPDGNIYRGWAIGIQKGGRVLILTILVILLQVLCPLFLHGWARRFFNKNVVTTSWQYVAKLRNETTNSTEGVVTEIPLWENDNFQAFWQVKILGTLFMLIVFFSNDRLLLRSDIQTDKLRQYFKKLNKGWMWVDVFVNSWATVFTGAATLPLFLASTDLKDIVLDSFGLLFLIGLDDYSGQVEYGVETSDFDDIIESEKKKTLDAAAEEIAANYDMLSKYQPLKYPANDPETNLKFTPYEKQERLKQMTMVQYAAAWTAMTNEEDDVVNDGPCEGQRRWTREELSNKYSDDNGLPRLTPNDEKPFWPVFGEDTGGVFCDRIVSGDMLYILARGINHWFICFQLPIYLGLQVTGDELPERGRLVLETTLWSNVSWWLPAGLFLALFWFVLRAMEYFRVYYYSADPAHRQHNEPECVGKRDLLSFLYIVIGRRPDPRYTVEHLD